MEKVVVIVGPTGIGKTKMSIEIASFLEGEVINGDAFQIYKGMDIGTAKVKEDEKNGIEHHLFDIVDIDQTFSVQEYQKMCREKIREINEKGKIPVIVGGTGLYLKAALYDYNFTEEDSKVDLSEFEKMNNETLHKHLAKIDPESAKNIHMNNRKRVLRAIEIFIANGETKTEIENKQEHKLLYDALFIGLETDRDTLYERCDYRVDKMFEEGLLKEVKNIYDRHHFKENLTSIQAIGYKELFDYFDNKLLLDEAIELIKKRTRNYVKRQYTWFKHQVDARWIDVDFECFDNSVQAAKKIVKEWNHG